MKCCSVVLSTHFNGNYLFMNTILQSLEEKLASKESKSSVKCLQSVMILGVMLSISIGLRCFSR